MRTTLAGWVGATLLLLLAVPSHSSELRIDLRRPWVRPGGRVKARVEWVIPHGGVQGRFRVRWYLTDLDGRTVASGARTARFGWNPPYRFRIRARVPREHEFDVLRLHVAMVDEEPGRGVSITVSAAVPVFVYRRGLRPGKERVTVTGMHVGSGTATPQLVPEGSSVEEYSHLLYGSAAGEILANPARDGARVRVTGRRASIPGILHHPMGPFPFIVEQVTFLDPLPEPLQRSYETDGQLHARIAPAELIGDMAWRTFLSESRTARVLRTRVEFDALNASMAEGAEGERAPLDSIAHVDFGEEMVVAVFAGISPTRDYRVEVTAARYDEATETTWIEYAVTGPRRKETGRADWVEPYQALILPARPGRVQFVRTELIPDRPAWW